ncbi:MAG: hypothetical protein ABW158_03795, partial [Candidatus Thiodiazotropha sp. 6PDIVS]
MMIFELRRLLNLQFAQRVSRQVESIAQVSIFQIQSRYWMAALLLSLTSFHLSAEPVDYPLFQKLVDEIEAGGTLVPKPGTYAGPVTITESITIDGQGAVTIDAGGKGSVIILDTDGATLKNLHLTNSGESHNTIDSGVQVRGDFNVIKDNVIDNTLFGVDLQQSKNNIVRGNHISSKPLELG